MAGAKRHEIDEPCGTIAGFKPCFEDQGFAPVAPCYTGRFIARGDFPAAVLFRAKQGRKTGLRIEPRPAEPVDRAVTPDEGGGLAVADQGIILDAGRHGGLLEHQRLRWEADRPMTANGLSIDAANPGRYRADQHRAPRKRRLRNVFEQRRSGNARYDGNSLHSSFTSSKARSSFLKRANGNADRPFTLILAAGQAWRREPWRQSGADAGQLQKAISRLKARSPTPR